MRVSSYLSPARCESWLLQRLMAADVMRCEALGSRYYQRVRGRGRKGIRVNLDMVYNSFCAGDLFRFYFRTWPMIYSEYFVMRHSAYVR